MIKIQERYVLTEGLPHSQRLENAAVDNSCFLGCKCLVGSRVSFLLRIEEQTSTLNQGSQVIHTRIEKLVC